MPLLSVLEIRRVSIVSSLNVIDVTFLSVLEVFVALLCLCFRP